MSKEEKIIRVLSSVLIIIHCGCSWTLAILFSHYGLPETCISRYDLTFVSHATILLLWNTLMIAEAGGFTHKSGRGDALYLGVVCILSVVLSFAVVPWKYIFLLDFGKVCPVAPTEASDQYHKAVTAIKVLGWIDTVSCSLEGVLSFCLIALFAFGMWCVKTQTDLRLGQKFNSSWYIHRKRAINQMSKHFGTQEGVTLLTNGYAGQNGIMARYQVFSEPIVMAYIFSICTWTIPLNDEVWVKEVCEICGSTYAKRERVLVNHVGQHLHEYCARKWFPSLKVSRNFQRKF